MGNRDTATDRTRVMCFDQPTIYTFNMEDMATFEDTDRLLGHKVVQAHETSVGMIL